MNEFFFFNFLISKKENIILILDHQPTTPKLGFFYFALTKITLAQQIKAQKKNQTHLI